MSVSLAAVTRDALVLSTEERLLLARDLLESVELDSEPEAEAAWEVEIVRRMESIKTGEAKTIPAAQVFARLREIAPER